MTAREKLCSGFNDWHVKLRKLVESNEVGGIEWLFVVSIHALHILTFSGWLKIYFDPIADRPTTGQRYRRDRVIEVYVVSELVALQLILWFPEPVTSIRIAAAYYFLFEVILNLSSIVFVGKLDVYPPTQSIERSLLLFGFNVAQVITIFAILYRYQFGHTAFVSLIHACLVFGTINHPLKEGFEGGYVVALQILTDFALLAVFLGAFVGSLGAFERDRAARPK